MTISSVVHYDKHYSTKFIVQQNICALTKSSVYEGGLCTAIWSVYIDLAVQHRAMDTDCINSVNTRDLCERGDSILSDPPPTMYQVAAQSKA